MTKMPLGWLGILRLGLVQTSLGAIVVLMTSALNRVMVIELALPATLPGVLVGLHYAVQMLRPRLGHGSDMGGRRTPWIIGGVAVLGLGGIAAAAATTLMATMPVLGTCLAALSFVVIGVGVGAGGTSLLVLLSSLVAEGRRPAAASLVWIMMIAGFVVTTAVAGRLLDPYSPERLIAVTAGVSAIALVVTCLAVWGVEPARIAVAAAPIVKTPFRQAIGQVWAEPEARLFTIFVFVSMLAYSAQDLILEPFAGAVFGLTLGETTRLASVQHGGVLLGMIFLAVASALFGTRLGPMRTWAVGGCIAAALTALGVVGAALVGPGWPLQTTYFVLGVANGVFAAAAIAAMMQMVGRGREQREGVRMGLWGAAQAIAFGLGGLAGAAATDVARWALGSVPQAYAAVFAGDALLFLAAGAIAAQIGRSATTRPSHDLEPLAAARG